MSRTFFLVFALLILIGCTELEFQDDPIEGKIKGIVFTGSGTGPYEDQMFSSMVSNHANFIALVPEATVYRQSLEVDYDFEKQWYGETKRAIFDGIDRARKHNLKIMLKPHLTISWDLSEWDAPELDVNDSVSVANYAKSVSDFISSQENKIEGKSSWRGEFMILDDSDWVAFEEEYSNFILDYARIADSLDVELFCLGTELKRVALEKPNYIRKLIKQVKKVYDGPVTYAANWDSYDKISFWDELDYIGVDAYFPVSSKKLPEIEELKKSWESIGTALFSLSSQFNKPIIFTEWGYEDEEFVGEKPWIMTRKSQNKNESMQAKAYRSMFEVIWNKSWMKGVFVWRWAPNTKESKRPDYSPRGKKAEIVLKNWFKEE